MTKIVISSTQRTLKINKQSVKDALLSLLSYYKIKCDEIAVYFISDKKMRKLHEDFFDDPTSTDCISFPYDNDPRENYSYLGDLFICPETAEKYIHKNGGDVYEEVTLYLVHGFLHLMGYDDIDPEDRKIMKKEERKLLKHLKTLDRLIHS